MGQIKRIERYKFDRRKGKSSQDSKNYGDEVRKKSQRFVLEEKVWSRFSNGRGHVYP